MRRAVELLNANQLGAALVRLWVKAGMQEGGASFLNRWERRRDAAGHEQLVRGFRQQIESGQPVGLRAAERAPLALITALDISLEALTTAQPFVTQPYEEEGATFWLVRAPAGSRRRHGNLPLGRQANNREAWFRCHAVIPVRTAGGVHVSVTPVHGVAAYDLERLVEAGQNLRFWIGHFLDQAENTGHVRLEWHTSAANKVRVTGISNASVRLESIRSAWRSAKDAAVHVVIFPELTITLDHRSVIREWLRNGDGGPFALVLAGSFHETEADTCYNTAELWDRKGERLLRHGKLRPYGEADGLAEDISDGNRVEVLITAIGALAIAICKDFLDDHARVATLFQEVPVDWVLVPSYGDETTLTLHRNRAKQLARFGPGSTTVVANQRNVEVGEGEPCPGFAFPAGAEAPLPVELPGSSISLPIPRQQS